MSGHDLEVAALGDGGSAGFTTAARARKYGARVGLAGIPHIHARRRSPTWRPGSRPG